MLVKYRYIFPTYDWKTYIFSFRLVIFSCFFQIKFLIMCSEYSLSLPTAIMVLTSISNCECDNRRYNAR